MQVLKFGGTSVADSDRIKQVIEIIKDQSLKHSSIAIVVSALGGITDNLIRAAELARTGDQEYEAELEKIQEAHVKTIKSLFPAGQQSAVLSEVLAWFTKLREVVHGIFLIRETSNRSMDYVLSFGERFSAFIISKALNIGGTKANYVDMREFLVTNDEFGNAKVNIEISYKNISEHFRKADGIQILTGFIAKEPGGATTTLGRGGSDYTAALVAAALKAKQIQIWTDVNGMRTADPRIVPNANLIEQATYQEAMEMSHFGAKIIHPPTLQPAMDLNIPILIKNTFEPEATGTIISREKSRGDNLVTGITSIPQISLLRVQGSGLVGIPGIAKRIFGALADNSINVILITQASSEHTVCFGVSPQDADPACNAIEREFELEIETRRVDPVIVEPGLSIISIIGENMRSKRGIAAMLFSTLAENDVNVVAIVQGSSEFNITVVISEADKDKAIKSVHSSFFKG